MAKKKPSPKKPTGPSPKEVLELADDLILANPRMSEAAFNEFQCCGGNDDHEGNTDDPYSVGHQEHTMDCHELAIRTITELRKLIK